MRLNALTNDELAAVIREREIAYGEALAELAARKEWSNCEEWDEQAALAMLAAKRQGDITPRRPKGSAPPMFRAGYEWAAISIFTILDSVLSRPSDDAVMLSEYKPVGKGLYKFDKVERVFDPRRRAALDLIKMLEGFVNIDLKAFWLLGFSC